MEGSCANSILIYYDTKSTLIQVKTYIDKHFFVSLFVQNILLSLKYLKYDKTVRNNNALGSVDHKALNKLFDIRS